MRVTTVGDPGYTGAVLVLLLRAAGRELGGR
jgi:hypothetical protein